MKTAPDGQQLRRSQQHFTYWACRSLNINNDILNDTMISCFLLNRVLTDIFKAN